jgi:hypothetical protein
MTRCAGVSASALTGLVRLAGNGLLGIAEPGSRVVPRYPGNGSLLLMDQHSEGS